MGQYHSDTYSLLTFMYHFKKICSLNVPEKRGYIPSSSPSLSADVLPEDGNYGAKVTINVMDLDPPNAEISYIATYRWKSRG